MTMNSELQTMIARRPLIPGLFQIAACAGGPAPVQKTSALGETPFAEMMLDPKKLEAILRTITRLEKTTARRISTSRLAKMSRARTARVR